VVKLNICSLVLRKEWVVVKWLNEKMELESSGSRLRHQIFSQDRILFKQMDMP